MMLTPMLQTAINFQRAAPPPFMADFDSFARELGRVSALPKSELHGDVLPKFQREFQAADDAEVRNLYVCQDEVRGNVDLIERFAADGVDVGIGEYRRILEGGRKNFARQATELVAATRRLHERSKRSKSALAPLIFQIMERVEWFQKEWSKIVRALEKRLVEAEKLAEARKSTGRLYTAYADYFSALNKAFEGAAVGSVVEVDSSDGRPLYRLRVAISPELIKARRDLIEREMAVHGIVEQTAPELVGTFAIKFEAAKVDA